MQVIILSLILFVKGVNSLKCYECSTSKKERCYLDQTSIECVGYEDSCYTLEFSNEKKNGYRKECLDGRQCANKCGWYDKLKYKCKVECCRGNDCNRHGIINQRSKRQFNSSPNTKLSWWMLLVTILMSLIYIRI